MSSFLDYSKGGAALFTTNPIVIDETKAKHRAIFMSTIKKLFI